MELERRRSPRVIVGPDGADALLRGALPVSVRDISPGGVGLRLGTVLEPGIYALTVLLRGLSLATPVRVTRCRTGAAGVDDGRDVERGWEAGAEFLWRDEGDVALLSRWLRRSGRRAT